MTAAADAVYAAARDAHTAAFAAAERALPAIMSEREAQSAAARAEVAAEVAKVRSTQLPEQWATWEARASVAHARDSMTDWQGEIRTEKLGRLAASEDVLRQRQAEWVDALMRSATDGRPSNEVAALRAVVAEYVNEESEWTTANWPHHKNWDDDRDARRDCDGDDNDEWCQACTDGRYAADRARAQAVLSVRAALVGDYATALTHAREAESIEMGVRGEVLTWGGLPEYCEVLLEVVEEQRVAVAASALKSADKDATLALECIGIYARKALEAVFDLAHAVDEQGAEAAFKSAKWNVEEIREYVSTMGRDMERLRDAWRARHRAEVSE